MKKSERNEEGGVHPGVVGMACHRMLELEREWRGHGALDGGSRQGAGALVG